MTDSFVSRDILKAFLCDYICIANEPPGFAIPIFRTGSDSNQLLIQRSDTLGRVSEFELFDPLDAPLSPLFQPRASIVGDECLHVFLTNDATPLVGSQIELSTQLQGQFDTLADFPLLALDVAEFCKLNEKIGHCRKTAFERLRRDYSQFAAETWRDQSILVPVFRRRVGSLLQQHPLRNSNLLERISIRNGKISVSFGLMQILQQHPVFLSSICQVMTDEADAFGWIDFSIQTEVEGPADVVGNGATAAARSRNASSQTVRTTRRKHNDSKSSPPFELLDDFRESIASFTLKACEPAGLFPKISLPALHYVHSRFSHSRDLWKLQSPQGGQPSFLKIMAILLAELAARDWLVEFFDLSDTPITPSAHSLREALVNGRPSVYVGLMFVLNKIDEFEADRTDREFDANISIEMLRDIVHWLETSNRDNLSTYLILKALYSKL